MEPRIKNITTRIVTEIARPNCRDNIKKLKRKGCTATKDSYILLVPPKLKAVETNTVIPGGGFMGCDYSAVKYELFNKQNKLICTMLTSNDGELSFQEVIFS